MIERLIWLAFLFFSWNKMVSADVVMLNLTSYDYLYTNNFSYPIFGQLIYPEDVCTLLGNDNFNFQGGIVVMPFLGLCTRMDRILYLESHNATAVILIFIKYSSIQETGRSCRVLSERKLKLINLPAFEVSQDDFNDMIVPNINRMVEIGPKYNIWLDVYNSDVNLFFSLTFGLFIFLVSIYAIYKLLIAFRTRSIMLAIFIGEIIINILRLIAIVDPSFSRGLISYEASLVIHNNERTIISFLDILTGIYLFGLSTYDKSVEWISNYRNILIIIPFALCVTTIGLNFSFLFYNQTLQIISLALWYINIFLSSIFYLYILSKIFSKFKEVIREKGRIRNLIPIGIVNILFSTSVLWINYTQNISYTFFLLSLFLLPTFNIILSYQAI